MFIWPANKRKEIIISFHVCLIWQINFDSKENNEKKSFSWQTKASIPCFPSTKRIDIIIRIHIFLFWQMNFDSKKWWEEKLFIRNQNINVIYPNEDNEIMIHNHEKKRDYYVNSFLSKLTNELWFWKITEGKAFFMKPKHQFIYPNRQNEFMVPNHEK